MASQLPTDHPHNEETWGGGVAPSISGPVEKVDVVHMDKTHQHVEEETTGDSSLDLNLVYADDDHEPEIHFRTIIAVFAMFVLLFTQNVALQGPPFIVRSLLDFLSIIDSVPFSRERKLINFPLSQSALVHRRRSQERCGRSDLGTELSVSCASGRGASDLRGFRHISSSQRDHYRLVIDFSDRRCHCPWLAGFRSTHRRSDVDWDRFRSCTP